MRSPLTKREQPLLYCLLLDLEYQDMKERKNRALVFGALGCTSVIKCCCGKMNIPSAHITQREEYLKKKKYSTRIIAVPPVFVYQFLDKAAFRQSDCGVFLFKFHARHDHQDLILLFSYNLTRREGRE